MRLNLLETARATGVDARRVRWIEARLDFDRRSLAGEISGFDDHL
jgi:hypothetical protein